MTSFIKATFMYITGLIVIILFCILLIFGALKLLLIKLLYRLFTGQNINSLVGMDALCFYISARKGEDAEKYYSDYHFYTVFTLQGNVNLEKYQKLIEERLLFTANCPTRYRRLTHHVVKKWGNFIWVPDANFQISNHVRLSDIGYENESSLLAIISKYTQLPLPLGQSPWEILLIPKIHQANTDPEEYCTVVYKFHHGLGDAMFVLDLLKSTCYYKEENGDEIYVADAELEATIPYAMKFNPCFRYFNDKPEYKRNISLKDIGYIIINALQIFFYFPLCLTHLLLHKERNLFSGYSLTGRPILAITNSIRLQTFKNIARANDCSINDVFISSVIQALKAFDPPSTKFRCGMPMLILPSQQNKQQNAASGAFVDIPVGSKQRLGHLKSIQNAMISSKITLQAVIIYLSMNACALYLPSLLWKNSTSGNATLFASNVRTVSKESWCLGAPLVNSCAFIPPSACGISIVLVTYNNQARITISIDEAIPLNPEAVARVIEEDIESLQSLNSPIEV